MSYPIDHKSLPALFYAQAENSPKDPFLSTIHSGQLKTRSYKDIVDKVITMAYVLKSLGVKKDTKVAICSTNCPEWAIVDLATQHLGGVTVPIYPTLSPEDMAYILKDSEAEVLCLQNKQHLKSYEKIKDGLRIKRVITFKKTELKSAIYIKDSLKKKVPKSFSLTPVPGPDDLASIVYTSGTTGLPKGVMLTHRNFLANVTDILKALPLSKKDRVLSFLPLSHVFERTAGYYTLIACGGHIVYARSMERVSEDFPIAKPTVLVSVPRLYEKFQDKVVSQLKGPKKVLFYWAQSTYRAYRNSPNILRRLKVGLAYALVMRKVAKRLGGELRFFVSGGAALGKELGEFFLDMGLTVIEGYGQTETAPVITCNRLEKIKMGSVGKALDSVKVKKSEDGELLIKGPNVSPGYWKKTKETKALFNKEGWLQTGDIVKLDRDKYIFIVDRKKDLIVLSNGKNVAPQHIEKTLLKSPYIEQVVVLGEKRNFVSALIYPNYDKIGNQDPTELIQNELDRVQKPLSRYEKVKAFRFLNRELTQESGELTPTLKVKRKVINSNYKSLINDIY